MNYQIEPWVVDFQHTKYDGGYALLGEKLHISQRSRKQLINCASHYIKESPHIINGNSTLNFLEYVLTTSSNSKKSSSILNLLECTSFEERKINRVSNKRQGLSTRDADFKERMLLGAAEKSLLVQVSSKLEPYKLQPITAIVSRKTLFLQNPSLPPIKKCRLKAGEPFKVPNFEVCTKYLQGNEPTPKEDEILVANEHFRLNVSYQLTELMLSSKSISTFHIEPIWNYKSTLNLSKIINFSLLTLPQLIEPLHSLYQKEVFDEDCDQRVLFKLSYPKSTIPSRFQVKLGKEKFLWKLATEQLKQMDWSIFRASMDRKRHLCSVLDEQLPVATPSALPFDSKFKLHVLADADLLLLPKSTSKTFTLTRQQPSLQKHTNNLPDTSFSSFVSRKKQKLQEQSNSNLNDGNINTSLISQLMVAGMDSSTMTEQNMSSIIQNKKTLPPLIKERACNIKSPFPESQEQIKTIVANYELIDSQVLSGLYANDESLNIIELDKAAFQSPCEIALNPDTCVIFIDVFRFFQKSSSGNVLYYIPILGKLLVEFQKVYCLITNIAVNSAENAYKCQTVMQSLYSAQPEVVILPTFDSKMTVSTIVHLIYYHDTFLPSTIANLNNGCSFNEMLLLGMGFNLAVAKHILSQTPNFAYLIEHLDDGLTEVSPKQLAKIKNVLLTPFAALPNS